MKQGFICFALLVSIYGYCQTTPLFKIGNIVLKSLAVSPDGRTVAIEGESSEVALWDLGTRKKIMTLKRDTGQLESNHLSDLGSFERGVTGKLFFRPDGQRLILSHKRGLVVWNPKVENPLIEFTAHPDFFDVSDNGQYVAVIEKAQSRGDYQSPRVRSDGPRNDNIFLFATQSGEMKKNSISSPSDVRQILFMPGESTLLILGMKGDLTLLDYLSSQITPLKPMFNDNQEESSVRYLSFSALSPYKTIAIHPNRKIVAVTDNKEKLYIYDFKEEKLKHAIELSGTIAIHGRGIERLEFTPDGKYLFGINKSKFGQELKKQIRFWDVETGKEVNSIMGDEKVLGLSFNSEGKYFAMAKSDYTKNLRLPYVIGIFDANTMLELESVQGNEFFAFFPNDPKRMVFMWSNGIYIHTIK